MGLGRLGGLPLRKGRAVDCVSWVCSRGWLVCLVIGVGNTPVVLLLPACVGSGVWWVPSRVCGGGMLSGFWGSAPWLPGLCSAALCGWGGVGVGGLVVNCIVDASILL